MKSAFDNKFALLTLDIIIILFCFAGLYQNYLKASLPFNLTTADNNLTVAGIDKNLSSISTGDVVLSIDSYSFDNWEEVELFLDGKKIGDEIELSLHGDGSDKTLTATLTNYYSLFELSIIGLVGLFFIVFAILVRIKAPHNNSSRLFHLASLGLGMVIMMTAGNWHNCTFWIWIFQQADLAFLL